MLNVFYKPKERFFNFVASKLKPVRFFTEAEWALMSSKEKMWVTYKHILYLVGSGESEINVYEQLVSGMVPWITLAIVSEYGNIWGFIVVIYLALKYIKFRLGDWKDKKDFNALDTEIGNRRNKLVREFRNYTLLPKVKK